jgi:hypothetical protein
MYSDSNARIKIHTNLASGEKILDNIGNLRAVCFYRLFRWHQAQSFNCLWLPACFRVTGG